MKEELIGQIDKFGWSLVIIDHVVYPTSTKTLLNILTDCCRRTLQFKKNCGG